MPPTVYHWFEYYLCLHFLEEMKEGANALQDKIRSSSDEQCFTPQVLVTTGNISGRCLSMAGLFLKLIVRLNDFDMV